MRTPTEEMVASVWARELQLPQVGLDEDFIDLGSQSLQGVAVVARLQEIFGVTIPLRVLFEEPTVADLAAWIDRQHGKAGSSQVEIIRLQEGSGLRPIFAVPGGQGGTRALYALTKLGRATDPQRPLLAFPGDPPVLMQTRKIRWVQAAATSLNEVVRLHQREGPYLLLGVCVGGIIAWEMARQLEMSGEAVHLFLVDTMHPGLRVHAPAPGRSAARVRRWGRKRRWLLRDATAPEDVFEPGGPRSQDGKLRLMMTRLYRPKPLLGRVRLLANADWYRVDATLGWDAVSDHLDVAVMTQNHGLMWSFQEVADWFRTQLNAVDPRGGSPSPLLGLPPVQDERTADTPGHLRNAQSAGVQVAFRPRQTQDFPVAQPEEELDDGECLPR